MTTSKKKPDPLVAAATILIDGKAFEAGDRITGVSKDQLDRAVSDRRVVRQSTFETLSQGVPAPALGEDDGDGEADAGSDDNGGSDE